MVTAERCSQWMIYRLPEKPPAQLAMHLACLQDCSREEPLFRRDLSRLEKLRNRLGDLCPPRVGEPASSGAAHV